MEAKIAEEFYQLVEWLKTKNDTEEILNEFYDRELGNILDYVDLGVDIISIGALTHSSRSLDFSLKIK